MSSDIEHWQINAAVFRDRVEETHYISDPSRNIRRKPETRIWKVEGFLGRGSFGEVRLEKSQDDGRLRAVKRIVIVGPNWSNVQYEKELSALLQFSKPKYKEAACFTNFLGWFRDGPEIFLAMEYMQLGDLESNVKRHSGRLPETEVRDITEQILLGLKIMHSESFAHRDLKPQNVLVVNGPPKWWVKLADFGLSKRLTETTNYNTNGGTESYMAPEMLDLVADTSAKGKYTDAVDIWAAGCIAYRLISGVVPFPRGHSLETFCKDKSQFPLKPLFQCGGTYDSFEFLRYILATNPLERPTAVNALRHTWFTSGSSAEIRETPQNSSDVLSAAPNNIHQQPSATPNIDTAGTTLSVLTINTASNAYFHSSTLSSHNSPSPERTVRPPKAPIQISRLPSVLGTSPARRGSGQPDVTGHSNPVDGKIEDINNNSNATNYDLEIFIIRAVNGPFDPLFSLRFYLDKNTSPELSLKKVTGNYYTRINNCNLTADSLLKCCKFYISSFITPTSQGAAQIPVSALGHCEARIFVFDLKNSGKPCGSVTTMLRLIPVGHKEPIKELQDIFISSLPQAIHSSAFKTA